MVNMDNNIAIFMRARLGSSRLPRKHLLKIKGKSVIQHLIERIKHNTNIEKIVLCTTDESEDDALEKIALKCGIKCFRGDSENVLKRYYDAGKEYKVRYIINVDCDDLLVDCELIDKTARLIEIFDADYLTWEGYPLGCIPTGMSYSGIKKLYEQYDEPIEHISLYFLSSRKFYTVTIKVSNSLLNIDYLNDIRLTLDYEDDFELFKRIYDELYDVEEHISLRSIINLFDENRDLLKINSYINKEYFEGFEKFVDKKFSQKSNTGDNYETKEK